MRKSCQNNESQVLTVLMILPSRNQLILGLGVPEALHSRLSGDLGLRTCRRLSKNAFVWTKGRESVKKQLFVTDADYLSD